MYICGFYLKEFRRSENKFDVICKKLYYMDFYGYFAF